MDRRSIPAIAVLAGTNGGGKSSVGGEALRQAGMPFSNPDEATRQILSRNPAYTLEEANSLAWQQNRQALARAIEERQSFAFETTLGGATITGLLLKASNVGLPVRMWYVGLESPELHIQRVRQRVVRGGHDIPEVKIRQRYDDSRKNLITLLPHLTELKVYDNSVEGSPGGDAMPQPKLILHLRKGALTLGGPLETVPIWAKPLVIAAIRLVSP